ncbi:MAG: UDP-glucose/GDP-mannose dehydrogenase family protein [Actinomycetota bacterium]|nr:UDP-glucose/GDP-mannose dehydrogenase family protein [Actinomycetota bacterium]
MTSIEMTRGARSHRVLVVGAGYVGLTSAVCFAHLGHEVVCVEANPSRLAPLLECRSPIHEPGLEELMAEGVLSDRLHFAAAIGKEEMTGVEVALLAVGTPPDGNGDPDLTQLAAAAREVSANAAGDLVVVVKSTVPPGSCEAIELVCAEAAPEGVRISVVSSPEFLRESRAVEDFLAPDRVVVGASDSQVADLVADLYPAGVPLVKTDRRGAELIKYAANAFLAVKISFANEVAAMCESLGTEAATVLLGVGLDQRIGKDFLRPGPGYGGSCLPKDVSGFQALGRAMGTPTRVVAAAEEVNEEASRAALMKLEMGLAGVTGKTIALLGLAFKPGTDDSRDSPALKLAELLVASGARVRAYDPLARVDAFAGERVDCAFDAIEGADALVVATAWQEFSVLCPMAVAEHLAGRMVLDAAGALDLESWAEAGLVVYGIGRGAPVAFHPVVWPPLRWAHHRSGLSLLDDDTEFVAG